MLFEIPFTPKPFSEVTVNLSGRRVTIVYKFNVRSMAWFLDLYDASEEPIVLGVKVVSGNLLWRHRYLPNLPTGSLWCMQFENTSDPIGERNLGFNLPYRLVWVEG